MPPPGLAGAASAEPVVPMHAPRSGAHVVMAAGKSLLPSDKTCERAAEVNDGDWRFEWGSYMRERLFQHRLHRQLVKAVCQGGIPGQVAMRDCCLLPLPPCPPATMPTFCSGAAVSGERHLAIGAAPPLAATTLSAQGGPATRAAPAAVCSCRPLFPPRTAQPPSGRCYPACG